MTLGKVVGLLLLAPASYVVTLVLAEQSSGAVISFVVMLATYAFVESAGG